MQTASILLAIAGDTGSIVPKYNVTAAEVALLQAIHGEHSVSEIEVTGDAVDGNGKPRGNRSELGRLRNIYGHAKNADGDLVLDTLYPGAGARVFETFDELEIDDSLFKDGKRSKAKKAKPADDKALEDMTKAELVKEAKRRNVDVAAGDNKDDLVKKLQDAPADDTDVDLDDGIGDMDTNPLG